MDVVDEESDEDNAVVEEDVEEVCDVVGVC